jgi:hypothetical protein
VPDAGQRVVQRPVRRLRKADAVGRDDRDVERGGQVDERLVVGFLIAQQMALNLDAHVRRSERADDAIDEAADPEARAGHGRAADERHQPCDVAVELLERQRAFPLRRSPLHPGHQP